MSSIQEQFDLALKVSQNGDINSCYTSEKVTAGKYYAYYTKSEWLEFRDNVMSETDRKAYEDGGGKELEEKYSSQWKIWMPPKMASYASSSRFIYTLLRNKGIIFEQKLRTPIPRSVSNMDGYSMNKELFIEAKCHEIYSSPNPKYKLAYRDFYNGLKQCSTFDYIPASENNDSTIKFFINGNPVEQFDIKQTISHLLGIANSYKIGITYLDPQTGKQGKHIPQNAPTFIYLLYNPKDLRPYLSEATWSEIETRYRAEKQFIVDNKVFFRKLFRYSLAYVGVESDKAESIASLFKVSVEDQFSILRFL
ncbi:MAG: hypothetical protein MJZ16_14275 [Bacteroidales bacterium]|nr:hypothetical protein [Bacteroidales bacterium]